ncbi:GDSL-like Lipase/Acylhydrolase superfamily protein [Actinidia rufa]|uniref:GDSL-like Lipase/Acylhydrolase superfamily protein n=1 Tax=Actinidia rufa TaxID=165716 RepID=A0A7J0GRK8_9ERIC|nr:GDSL-like Lipase/Acylhydrolase superfamily protein [Actinidia rufa]
MSPEIFFFLLIQVSLLNLNPCAGKDLPKFQTILIFGDSTVDTGNNNYIPTIISKGNHPPYGQDFPGREATGRFSNGKLVPDLVASMLGIKETVPPFLDPNLTNEDLITGVSFASAGSGYDEVTSLEDGSIPVSQQPGMFQNYVDRLKGIVGEEMATNITNGALVIINAGTNDFVFNFYDLATRTPYFTINGIYRNSKRLLWDWIDRSRTFLLFFLHSVSESFAIHVLGRHPSYRINLPVPYQLPRPGDSWPDIEKSTTVD